MDDISRFVHWHPSPFSSPHWGYMLWWGDSFFIYKHLLQKRGFPVWERYVYGCVAGINSQYHTIFAWTLHTIVSWPNAEQWLTVLFILLIWWRCQDKVQFSQSSKKMDEIKTHSIIYCINDNWENWFNLRHTLDRIYSKNILYVQWLQISQHNEDNVGEIV